MAESSVNHLPGGKWEFDAGVTECFEDMLERSIPQYETMRNTVFSMGQRFLKPGATVIDLGCSKGGAIAPFVVEHPETHFLGVEISQPMAQAARDRFQGFNNVSIEEMDIRHSYPAQPNVCLVVSNLTIQFTPIEYRQGIIQRIYDSLVPGGGFVLIEKILGESAKIDSILVEEYYKFKGGSYSPESIARKRLSLEGVLVPVTARWNEDLLKGAGFHEVTCFWRFLNFAGWLAIKA